MRRRTLLLAAGLLAYFIGAAVRVYLSPDELHGCRDAGYRVLVVARHPDAALHHPLAAVEYLVAPSCSN